MRTLKFKNKSRIALTLSLLIHLSLILMSRFISDPKDLVKPVEIEIFEQKTAEPKFDRQVVRHQEIPLDKIIDSSRRTDLLSEKTVRVREQTRAQKLGLTQNRSHSSSVQQRSPLSRFLPQLNGHGSLAPTKIANAGVSTISEDLPQNIKIGDITALDTDQYLYYTFISRAGESFYYEWAPLIQAILENPPVLLKAKGPGKYTTILEVWFLPSGKIHSLHILKPSGVPEFDFAATKSFKTVAMVPNPPKQKLDPDGIIRFTWQLTAHYEPKALVRQ